MTTPPGEGTGEGNDPEGGAGSGTGGEGTPANQSTNPGGSGQGGEGTQTGDPEAHDPARAQALIDKLRGESATARKQLGEARTALKAREDADKTQQQKDQEELERLRGIETTYNSEKRERVTRGAVTKELEKQGATKVDALYKLALGDLELDDEGNPTNLTAVVKSLKGDYPEFFPTGSADGPSGRGQGTPAGVNMNDRLRQSLRRG